jgi:hypothetical protein
MSAVKTFHKLVAHRAADVGKVHDARNDLAAVDAKQRAGRAGLQEYVQAVQVSAHSHEGRRLLQTGNESAVRARRDCAPDMRTISMGLARLMMRSI